jgi:Guanylylate cyclase
MNFVRSFYDTVSTTFWQGEPSNHIEDCILTSKYDYIYVRQRDTWDCGIACLRMSLRWYGINNSHFPDMSHFSQKRNPLWTIDIFVALHESGIQGAELYTTCVGVNPAHSSNDWYAAHLTADELRVEEKFKLAASSGWPVILKQLELVTICKHLQSSVAVAIVLIDLNTFKSYPK